MVVSLKTDLRFPESGQQGHGARIIHKTLYNLKHNKNTTLLTIEKICSLLECRIDEVVEFKSE